MKKLWTKLILFLCAAIFLIFGAVACAPADTRTPEQKAWDELNSIGTGVFEEGTVVGKYTYDDYSGNATKIEITVNEYENVVINILEGKAAGRTVTIGVYGWRKTIPELNAMYFNLKGDTAYFNEFVILGNEFFVRDMI